jgi:uncharacterized protein (DUF433 family)
MKITVEGEHSCAMAAYLRCLLAQHGIPVEDGNSTSFSNIRRVGLQIGERMESPVVVDHKETVTQKGWAKYLEFDKEMSEASPVVKGTWVTVNHVVSLIVDGWTWQDILKTHPELCEDDIRACLRYAVEEDGVEELREDSQSVPPAIQRN